MKTSILKHDFDKKYTTLVVCFSGHPIFDRQEGGRFEWQGFFGSRDVKTLHLRDYFYGYYFGNWYNEDGTEIGCDVNSHVGFLSKIIEESGCERVVMTGASLGAFAAILYGVLLNVNCVMAFNPQTYISNDSKSFSGLAKNAYSHATSDDQKLYFDLTNLDYEKYTGKIHFHFGTHWSDTEYIDHIKAFCKDNPHLGGRTIDNSLPDVKIYLKKHGINGHGRLCGRLKKMGKLGDYFDRYAL